MWGEDGQKYGPDGKKGEEKVHEYTEISKKVKKQQMDRQEGERGVGIEEYGQKCGQMRTDTILLPEEQKTHHGMMTNHFFIEKVIFQRGEKKNIFLHMQCSME